MLNPAHVELLRLKATSLAEIVNNILSTTALLGKPDGVDDCVGVRDGVRDVD